jgi:multidrug efflux pump
VTSQTDLSRPSQFSDIIIKNANGFPVRMRDVARVQEGAADERSGVRLNGRSRHLRGVIRQATANPLELSKGCAR